MAGARSSRAAPPTCRRAPAPPVVPMFIDGTGAIFGKGMKRPKPGKTKVVFGSPLEPVEGESHAPVQRAHRGRRDDARRRGTDRFLDVAPTRATGTNPKLTGPDYNGWRRQWALAEHRKLGKAGHAPPPKTPLAQPRLETLRHPSATSADGPPTALKPAIVPAMSSGERFWLSLRFA